MAEQLHWAVRRIIDENDKMVGCYAIMALSMYGFYTDRYYAREEVEAMTLADALNKEEPFRE